jgi:hypothetical protein
MRWLVRARNALLLTAALLGAAAIVFASLEVARAQFRQAAMDDCVNSPVPATARGGSTGVRMNGWLSRGHVCLGIDDSGRVVSTWRPSR